MDATPQPIKKAPLPEPYDSYKNWLEAQRIPIVRGFYIEDINTVELEYWDRKGAPSAFVILEGTGGMNDAYICEIPPAGKTKPQRHLFEETVFVTKGHGTTSVWQTNGPKHTFEWGPGSLFAIPLNAHYQHFNASGSEAVRFYAVSNCSFFMNLFRSEKFIFDNDFVFDDRFDPNAEGYFEGEGKMQGILMTTNFVPDTLGIKLHEYNQRGKGATNIKFDLAQQSMGAHISEFPVGTYKKAHRHGPGAHVIILSGQGYSTLWPAGQEPRRYDWKPGTVIVPPDQWFHQHFNTGSTPARYLALHLNNRRFKPILNAYDATNALADVKDGGWQIPFEDEDPGIHRAFVAELEKAGAACGMCDYYPGCPKRDHQGKR